MEEYRLKIDENGNVSSEKELSQQERESQLTKISEMIADPTIHPAEIKRIIAAEIAMVNKLMLKYDTDENVLAGMRVKNLSERVKSLRELGKEVMEADVLSKKDFLNWEGKKFRLALDRYREGAIEAMKTAKLDESTINSILNHWRDIMQDKEDEIRRAIDKLDTK
jgi:hypothetical protein